MKAIVMEIRENHAAILLPDGNVKMVKNHNYTIGEVIRMKNNKKKIVSMVASAAVLFLVAGISLWLYKTPHTYVSLDVNPSIEYQINRFNKVLSVTALNDDGENIIEELSLDSLVNENVEEAVLRTIDRIDEEGYFEADTEGGIVFSTSSSNNELAEKLALELQNMAQERVAERGQEVNVEAYAVGLERVEEAKELGTTPGRLNLIEKMLDAQGESATGSVEEWLNVPVKDIMKIINEDKINKEKNAVAGEETGPQKETNASQNGNVNPDRAGEEAQGESEAGEVEQTNPGQSVREDEVPGNTGPINNNNKNPN